MNLVDLDPTTRFYMRAEVELDLAAGTLFLSKRLSPHGRVEFPDLLLKAVDSGSPETLAAELRQSWRLNLWERSVDSRGRPRRRRVPYNTPDTMGDREFNRYYIRGLCARAQAEGLAKVEIYRAKATGRTLTELQPLLGAQVDPAALLADLRAHNDGISVEAALGLSGGANSGLSVRLVWVPHPGPMGSRRATSRRPGTDAS